MISFINRSKERQMRYLSQSIQLEEAMNPVIVQSTMLTISVGILVFIGWAGLTNINEVAHTPGEVVPHGYQQSVQHLEGGVVAAIHVRESEAVKKGQVLITLEDKALVADIDRLKTKRATMALQEERLRAYHEGRSPDLIKADGAADSATLRDQEQFFAAMKAARKEEQDIIQTQISQRQKSIAALDADLRTAQATHKISRDIYSRKSELNAKGYSSSMGLLESRQVVLESEGRIAAIRHQISIAKSEIEEFHTRLSAMKAGQNDDVLQKLDAVRAESRQDDELIEKLEGQRSRLVVRAPEDGIVKGLAVNTIGAVVQPGQVLMEIVPSNKTLEVQVKISPKDIGHVAIGQDVQLKFSAFDFSRYGSVMGKISQISATTFSAENGDRFYQGRVSISQPYVGENPDNHIVPGMTVMADIITGRKTILEYLVKPIHVSLMTAFTER